MKCVLSEREYNNSIEGLFCKYIICCTSYLYLIQVYNSTIEVKLRIGINVKAPYVYITYKIKIDKWHELFEASAMAFQYGTTPSILKFELDFKYFSSSI